MRALAGGVLRRTFHEARRRSIGAAPPSGSPAAPAWVPEAPLLDATDYWSAPPGSVFLFGAYHPAVPGRAGTPDWSADPVHGVRWPSDRFTPDIDLRGAGRVGDVKFVWEPSRFQHLFDLSADPAHARLAVRHVASWIEQNRWMLGVHWDNGLEAALRSISWTFCDGVRTRRGDRAWLALRPRVLSALAHHARFILQRVDRNELNHLVADAAGLVVLGTSYPQLEGAGTWRRSGTELLLTAARSQVLADGGHVERAPAYGRFVADLFLLTSHVLEPVDPSSSATLLAAATRLLESLQTQADPRAALPGYGDDDGAQVLWTSRPEHRLALSLALAAARTGRSDFRHAARVAGCEERAERIVVAVLGPRDLARWRATDAEPPATGHALLPDTGVAVWRSGRDHDAGWLLFRCGPAGVAAGAHAHMDQLQCLWQGPGGHRLVDPGTPTYNGDDAQRAWSTGTPAHNTVAVDDASQAERVGRFRWAELPRGRDLEAGPTPEGWRAGGTIGYRVGECEVRHRRTVTTVDGSRVAIDDELLCPRRHRLRASLLFAGRLGWDTGGERLIGSHGAGLEVRCRGWGTPRLEIAEWCPTYGKGLPATRLVFEAEALDRFRGSIELDERHG